MNARYRALAAAGREAVSPLRPYALAPSARSLKGREKETCSPSFRGWRYYTPGQMGSQAQNEIQRSLSAAIFCWGLKCFFHIPFQAAKQGAVLYLLVTLRRLIFLGFLYHGHCGMSAVNQAVQHGSLSLLTPAKRGSPQKNHLLSSIIRTASAIMAHSMRLRNRSQP